MVLSHFLIAFYRALLSKRRHPSHYLILSHGEVEKSRNLLSSSSSLAYIITKSAVLKFRQSESIWYWCGRFVFKSLYPPQRWWWQSSAVWLMLQHELMLLSFIVSARLRQSVLTLRQKHVDDKCHLSSRVIIISALSHQSRLSDS